MFTTTTTAAAVTAIPANATTDMAAGDRGAGLGARWGRERTRNDAHHRGLAGNVERPETVAPQRFPADTLVPLETPGIAPNGLKTRCPFGGVRVRVPPRARRVSVGVQGFVVSVLGAEARLRHALVAVIGQGSGSNGRGAGPWMGALRSRGRHAEPGGRRPQRSTTNLARAVDLRSGARNLSAYSPLWTGRQEFPQGHGWLRLHMWSIPVMWISGLSPSPAGSVVVVIRASADR